MFVTNDQGGYRGKGGGVSYFSLVLSVDLVDLVSCRDFLSASRSLSISPEASSLRCFRPFTIPLL